MAGFKDSMNGKKSSNDEQLDQQNPFQQGNNTGFNSSKDDSLNSGSSEGHESDKSHGAEGSDKQGIGDHSDKASANSGGDNGVTGGKLGQKVDELKNNIPKSKEDLAKMATDKVKQHHDAKQNGQEDQGSQDDDGQAELGNISGKQKDMAKKGGKLAAKGAKKAAPGAGKLAGGYYMFKSAKDSLMAMMGAGVEHASGFMSAVSAIGAKIVGGVKAMGSAIASGIAHAGAWVGGMMGVGVKAGTTVLVAGTMAVAAPGTYGLFSVLNFNRGADDSSCNIKVNNAATEISDGLTSGGGSGDFLKEGTHSYKVADSVWKAWTKEQGFGGAATAGIMGNIAHEGGFSIPDRAQGHFGDDEKTNGVSEGVTPVGGGAGLYQFTPYTKYAPMGDKKWLDVANQTKFVVKSEIKPYMNTKSPYNVGGWSVGTYNKYAHLDDPEQAAKAWFSMYERGAAYAPAKSQSAKDIYVKWNGKSVKADDSLLGKMSGDADSNSAAAGSAEQSAKDACDDDSLSDSSDVKDGSGSIKESAPGGVLHWGKDEVPADVKKYIKDPKSAGMGWASSKGWFNPGDQCVHFSSSYFARIWSGLKNDHVMVPTGSQSAHDWAAANGGKTSKTPHAGAIASVPGGVPGVSTGGPDAAGHTWIVLHVLANGDTIIAEQNMPGKSGQGAGESNTWNFGWISKKLSDKYATYYTPDKSHKLNWNAK